QSALLYARSLFATPNYGGGNLPALPNFIWSESRAIDNEQFGIRLDHRFRNNDTLFGRYSWMTTDQTTPGPVPAVPTVQKNYAQSVMLSFNHLFDPTFILNFRT